MTCDGPRDGLVLEKVKGYSWTTGPNKDDNVKADRLAKLGAAQGTPWEFQEERLPTKRTCMVNAITRQQAQERQENPQTCNQTLFLAWKPRDSDLVTMQVQDPSEESK